MNASPLLQCTDIRKAFPKPDGAELLVLRLAIGFLLGTDYVVSKTLLTEFVPRRLRGRILGLLSVAWAGGYACAYAVGFCLTGTGTQSWRWMLLASAAPCLLIAPLRITMPESPLWLANHGYREQSARVVRSKLGGSVRPPAPAPVIPPPREDPAPSPPAPPRAVRPAPQRRVPPVDVRPGYLSVSARPWALLSVDGRLIGNTPRIKVRLSPGVHQIRLQRAGFKTYEAAVEVKAGETVSITNITLTATSP